MAQILRGKKGRVGCSTRVKIFSCGPPPVKAPQKKYKPERNNGLGWSVVQAVLLFVGALF